MATSRASNFFWSILAAAILVFALFAAAADQPPEVADNQRPPPPELASRRAVKFYLWCMTLRNSNRTCNPWEINCTGPNLIGCGYSYGEVRYHYEKTGRLSEDYVDALRIYHNYNQTDVDIEICQLSRSRCSDRIKALNARCTSTDIKSGLYPYFC
ncbi:hypothetical protein ACP275_10G149100 [Erythranthe tilingii]